MSSSDKVKKAKKPASGSIMKENNIFIMKEDFVRGSIGVRKNLNELKFLPVDWVSASFSCNNIGICLLFVMRNWDLPIPKLEGQSDKSFSMS